MEDHFSDDEEYEAVLKWNCGMYLKRKARAQKCQIFHRWRNLIQKTFSGIKFEEPYMTQQSSKFDDELADLSSNSSTANHQLQQELQRLRNQEEQLRQETKKAKETLDSPQYQSSFSVLSNTRTSYHSKL